MLTGSHSRKWVWESKLSESWVKKKPREKWHSNEDQPKRMMHEWNERWDRHSPCTHPTRHVPASGSCASWCPGLREIHMAAVFGKCVLLSSKGWWRASRHTSRSSQEQTNVSSDCEAAHTLYEWWLCNLQVFLLQDVLRKKVGAFKN